MSARQPPKRCCRAASQSRTGTASCAGSAGTSKNSDAAWRSMRPAVGAISPAIRRSSVVLPRPSPPRSSVSPGRCRTTGPRAWPGARRSAPRSARGRPGSRPAIAGPRHRGCAGRDAAMPRSPPPHPRASRRPQSSQSARPRASAGSASVSPSAPAAAAASTTACQASSVRGSRSVAGLLLGGGEQHAGGRVDDQVHQVGQDQRAFVVQQRGRVRHRQHRQSSRVHGGRGLVA